MKQDFDLLFLDKYLIEEVIEEKQKSLEPIPEKSHDETIVVQ